MGWSFFIGCSLIAILRFEFRCPRIPEIGIHAFKVTLRQVIASISYLNDVRYKHSNYINVDECLHERRRSNTLKFQNFKAQHKLIKTASYFVFY